MSKFEEIDNNHKTAALYEKVNFAVQSLNRLEGCKIKANDTAREKLQVVRGHMISTQIEIAELQELMQVLVFLDKYFVEKNNQRVLNLDEEVIPDCCVEGTCDYD